MSSVRESGTSHRHGSTDREERRALRQILNDRLAESARNHHFTVARVPFQCECGAPDCEEFALHTLTEYEELREIQPALLASSHA